ncbi:MAG: hypothetical protein EOM50_05200 [Erysipelotrichia bacterium]|nr:hypothetical protein [Erysipelotrichia bacterium]NCC54717.1 hypothetical protein [Erysipelotrichia bacterium]
MKLLFKQKIFSWFDSYDIYNEQNEVVYRVQGKLSWGHCLHIYNQNDEFIAHIQEIVLTLLPKFELYEHEQYIGEIKKELTFFKPVFTINFNGWQIKGDIFEWDYEIIDAHGNLIATINKELFNLSDTYVLDIQDPSNALHVLMVTLAIDAQKCSGK